MPNIRYITRRDGCGQRRAAGWLIGPSRVGVGEGEAVDAVGGVGVVLGRSHNWGW